jgi:hypothetical protein
MGICFQQHSKIFELRLAEKARAYFNTVMFAVAYLSAFLPSPQASAPVETAVAAPEPVAQVVKPAKKTVAKPQPTTMAFEPTEKQIKV